MRVKIDGEVYDGMAYIGTRPTINGTRRNIEVNIFDFEREIYNQQIRMEFYNFVRDDMKFDSLDALKEQIRKDKLDVEALLGSE